MADFGIILAIAVVAGASVIHFLLNKDEEGTMKKMLAWWQGLSQWEQNILGYGGYGMIILGFALFFDLIFMPLLDCTIGFTERDLAGSPLDVLAVPLGVIAAVVIVLVMLFVSGLFALVLSIVLPKILFVCTRKLRRSLASLLGRRRPP